MKTYVIPMPARNYIKNIGIVGEPEVGKNELVKCVAGNVGMNDIADRYLATIGVGVYKRISDVDLPKHGGLHRGTFLMWDMTGQKGFDDMREFYCKNVEGAIVVGDATRTETIDAMSKWANYMTERLGDIQIAYAVNKIDLVETERHKELRERARKAIGKEGRIFLTSAKTGKDVKEPFKYMDRKIAEDMAKRNE